MAKNDKRPASLDNILSSFFAAIIGEEDTLSMTSPLIAIMKNLYVQKPTPTMCSFCLDDEAIASAINQLKDNLRDHNPDCFKAFNIPLTYLLDELICNIQQHAKTDLGYAFLEYNTATNTIEILIADMVFHQIYAWW